MAAHHLSTESVHRDSIRGEGGLVFKDEGETQQGLTFGPLVLRRSGFPVYPDGRWVTLRQARQVAEHAGVELFEF